MVEDWGSQHEVMTIFNPPEERGWGRARLDWGPGAGPGVKASVSETLVFGACAYGDTHGLLTGKAAFLYWKLCLKSPCVRVVV